MQAGEQVWCSCSCCTCCGVAPLSTHCQGGAAIICRLTAELTAAPFERSLWSKEQYAKLKANSVLSHMDVVDERQQLLGPG